MSSASQREWRSGGLAALPALLAGACLLAVVATAGCEKKNPPQPPEGRTKTEGAAPESYLPSGSAKPAATTIVALPPLPKPTGPLPQGTSCATPQCHSAYLTAPQVHGPVARGACDACHQDDAGGHKYPLKRSADQLCGFCHVVAGTRAYRHAALDQGCLACHNAHQSNAKFLLKEDSTERLCARCHRVPQKKYAHAFFMQGQCTICHQSHQADNKSLLRGGAGSQNCLMCHEDVRRNIAASSHVHKPAEGTCTSCHGPHATDYQYRLKQPLDQLCLSCHDKTAKHIEQASVAHAAVQDRKGCDNCHAPHASSWPGLLLGRQDKVCLTCHDEPVRAAGGGTIPDMRPQLIQAKFRHGPVASGDCSPCHDAHGAAMPMLLRQAFPATFYARFDVKSYALCFGCHSEQMVLTRKTANLTGFRNAQDNLHYLHVNRDDKGRTCKACHAVHGSNLPKHMAQAVPFEGSKWEMAIQFEQTSDGGRCSPGCHEPMSYGRDKPAQRPTTKGAP